MASSSDQGPTAVLSPMHEGSSYSQSSSYQDSFLRLLKEITKLQWVRESLPSHSKYHEALRQKYEKETNIKKRLEKPLESYKQDGSTADRERSFYVARIENLQQCQARLDMYKEQLHDSQKMLDDLLLNKRRLDDLCDELHRLYDEVVPAISDNPAFFTEQQLKREVYDLANEIPKFEASVSAYTTIQRELYTARDLMEKAMMVLPGSKMIFDRQTMASHSIAGSLSKSQSCANLFDISDKTIEESQILARQASEHVEAASNVETDSSILLKVPVIKEFTAAGVLEAYRGYRLQIESLLRTQINPRYSQLQIQLAVAKYQYEQKTIEWIDQQIVMLESVLRENGGLQNMTLEKEMAMLRVGSNAAMAAVAAEANGRVTVDDVLEIDASEEPGALLPEYSENSAGSSSRIPRTASNEDSPSASSSSNAHGLPAYSSQPLDDQPPAYSI